jgi:hypothetical protein
MNRDTAESGDLRRVLFTELPTAAVKSIDPDETRMSSWTVCQRSLLSIAGTGCQFNRYDERCSSRRILGSSAYGNLDSCFARRIVSAPVMRALSHKPPAA